MSNLEKLWLLSKSEDCLTIFNNVFLNALQQKDFDSARDWLHEYAGALKALADVERISQKQAGILTERAFQRYRMAKYPGAYEENE